MVIAVIIANSAFLPSLSQVTHKVRQRRDVGVEKGQKIKVQIAFFFFFF